ncbi:hypothetical protein PSDVSF_20310 [Pseudodesulfovibrio sediminis]|uniref:Uncharacterized protein n=1 Tax=Pseudodesulfovibrio sediminis TaxID=2810563 RepID=A0ABN6EU59_9BACT|nr:hypothetical protein PSDVSF_20310 [Pseudodesulfovibrio sediminis]
MAAEKDVNIAADRDVNIIPGRNSQSSQKSSKEGGIGIGLTLSENEVSISAGYKGVETKTNSSGKYNAGSLISAGNDVKIDAGRNINQVSSEIEAGQDVNMKAGEDLNVTAAQDVEHLDEYVKSVEVGLKLAAKQSVSTAIRTLVDTPKNMTSGEGGVGAKAVTAGSGALQAVSAAQQVSNPSASVSLTAGLSMTESRFSSDSATSVSSQTSAGRDANIEAGKNLTIEGATVLANEDVALTAGEDIAISSAANNRETSSSSSSISASAGIGATVSAANGAAAGVQVSGAASGSDSDYRSDSNTNAQVVAGQDLTVKSGQDTTVAGANLEGNKVNMDVGDNLVVASKQDTSKSKSSNWSIGGSATIGMGASVAADAAGVVGMDADSQTGDSANIGMGKGSGSSAWVNNQTSIVGKEQVDIRVENNTHVEGAVIAAENGNLKLDTDTLTYKDIYDHNKASSYQASLSGSVSAENEKDSETRKDGEEGNPYAGTLEGSASSHDRRQINRATIGEGEIIIRSDPAAGLEGLNRDLAKAQEITKNEKTSVTVYIDSAAIEEIAGGFKGIQENAKKTTTAISDLIADLKGKAQLTPAEMTWLKDGILEELKKSNICGSEVLAEEIGGAIGDSVANVYNKLREMGYSNSKALAEIEKSFQTVGKWAEESVAKGVAINSVDGRNYVKLPDSNGIVGVVAGIDDGAIVLAALATLTTIAILSQTNPELARQLGEGLANTVDAIAPIVNEKLIAVSDSYASLTNQTLVQIDFGDGYFHDVSMDVLEYDQATGHPSLVKVKDSNAVYEVTYDPSTDTLYPTYGQKELVYKDGIVVEASNTVGNGSGSSSGSGISSSESTPGDPNQHGNGDDDDPDKKPEYKSNQAHKPGGNGFRPNKTVEPKDAAQAYKNAVPKGDGKTWYSWSTDGKQIYRYSADNAGTAHFNGVVDKRLVEKMGDKAFNNLGTDYKSVLRLIRKTGKQ